MQVNTIMTPKNEFQEGQQNENNNDTPGFVEPVP